MPLKTQRRRFRTQRIVTGVQRSILKELPSGTRKALSQAGFSPRPVQQTVDTSKAAAGWGAPGPPVVARGGGKPRTVVRVGPKGRPVLRGKQLLGEPLKPILRHEIGHQILWARGVSSAPGFHHRIQEGRGTEAGTARLGRTSISRLMRMKRRGRQPQSQTSSVSTQGFQTPHLKAEAQTGSPTKQRRARDLMRKLGRRMRTRGVDF